MTALQLTHAMGDQHGPAIVRRLTGPRLNTNNPNDPTDPAMGGFLVDCDKGVITQDYRVASAPPKTVKNDSKSSSSGKQNNKSSSPKPEPEPEPENTDQHVIEAPKFNAKKKNSGNKPNLTSMGRTKSFG